jgi:small-conductance mechanosensitive channel
MQLPESLRPDSAVVVIDRFWNAPLFSIGQTPVTPATVLTFGVLVLLAVVVSRLAAAGAQRALSRRAGGDLGAIAVTARLIHYAVLLAGLGVAVQTVGIDLSILFTAGAFFAVALGFAMQNIAQNFVAGVILLVERTIKPGDVIEVDGRVVRVTRMGLRGTVARTRDEEDIIIPNATLVQNTVINYTLRDVTYRLRASVGVSYGSDMTRVEAVLLEAARGVDGRIPEREPVVLMTEFADSSVTFEVSVWITDPWSARVRRSALHRRIWWAFKDAGVTIPFPQRDVHVFSRAEVSPGS